MNSLNKISNISLINFTFALFPLSVILGNLAINVNIIIFIGFGSFILLKNKLYAKQNFLISVLGILFLFIVFSSIYNLILNYELKDVRHVYKTSLIKSLLFFRYFLFVIIFIVLTKNNILNIKYFLISVFLLTYFLVFDIFFQDIFGFDVFGLQNESPSDNSGFFGKELIAGGFLQKFSLVSIFLTGYLLRNEKKYRSIFIALSIILFGAAILLATNRISFFLFLLGIILFMCISKNNKKIIFFSFSIVILIFGLLLKYDYSTNLKYRSFFGSVNGMIQYTIIKSNNSIKETLNKNVKATPLDPSFYKKGSGHLELFRAAGNTFKENPVFGHGMKNFFQSCININGKLYKLGTPIDCNSHPHNYYFEILSSLGVLGILIFLVLMIRLYRDFFLFSFQKFENFKDLNSVVYNFSLLTLIVEFFPLRSSGSFFSTYNSFFIFLFIALMIGTKKVRSTKI